MTYLYFVFIYYYEFITIEANIIIYINEQLGRKPSRKLNELIKIIR